jgi:hypothetical protein
MFSLIIFSLVMVATLNANFSGRLPVRRRSVPGGMCALTSVR